MRGFILLKDFLLLRGTLFQCRLLGSMVPKEAHMTRFSLIKLRHTIDYPDFLRCVHALIKAFKTVGCDSVELEIVFYEKLPHSCTTIGEDWEEAARKRENLSCRLATVHSIKEAVPSLFDAAVNVHVHIKPERGGEHDLRYAYFECLGLLPQHAVFYIQPDDIGERMKQEVLQNAGFVAPYFTLGDGFERSHSVSLR